MSDDQQPSSEPLNIGAMGLPGVFGFAPPRELADLQALIKFYGTMFEQIPMPMSIYKVVSRTEYIIVANNYAARHVAGHVLPDMTGKLVSEVVQPDQAERLIKRFQECLDKNGTIEGEALLKLPFGDVWAQFTLSPIHDTNGNATHIVTISHDITALKQREEETLERQARIIEQQAATLAELSTPLLSISAGTVVMPLVGAVDSRRAQQIMESLLEGVAETRATFVILDITGVSVVDTQVANALIRASQAVKLLGSQIVLTGIRPEVAQTLVGLGVDLQTMITRGTLRDGITYALNHS